MELQIQPNACEEIFKNNLPSRLLSLLSGLVDFETKLMKTSYLSQVMPSVHFKPAYIAEYLTNRGILVCSCMKLRYLLNPLPPFFFC